jgi:hypothetical protein
MKYLSLALLCCIAAMAGSYYVSSQVPQRQRSAEEVEWISICAVMSGMGMIGCKGASDELFQMGYFQGSIPVEDMGIILQ